MLMAVDSRESVGLLEVAAQLPILAAVDLNRIAVGRIVRFRIERRSSLLLLLPSRHSNDH